MTHRNGPLEPYSVARDEVLETLWTARESGDRVTVDGLDRRIQLGRPEQWSEVAAHLQGDGLVALSDGALELTADGERAARELIRRHRLAEVLFGEVLDMPMDETEHTACGVEHVLSARATEAVCSFLGHPTVCPHGLAIPPGDCCVALEGVRPLLRRLSDLGVGDRATVTLLAPEGGQRLDQLTDLGLFPGSEVVVRQRRPALVIGVDNTVLAVDTAIAGRVFVRDLG